MTAALTTGGRIGHAVGEQRVADELDDSAPSSVPMTVARPPVSERAADGDRGDGVELHAEADEIGVRRGGVAAITIRPAMPGQQAADDVDHACLTRR